MTTAPFITLDNITVRLRDRWFLANTSWQIRRGQHWVILGPNGAGKSTLANVLMGQAPVVQGWVRRHYENDPEVCRNRQGAAMVSSEQYHHLYGQERLLGEMRHFSGSLAEGTAAGELLARMRASDPDGRFSRLAALFNLSPLLPKPIMALSSGEMRKLLTVRALMGRPCLLVLDEPFNGLDAEACDGLVRYLAEQVVTESQIVMIVHRASEIPSFCTHVLQLDSGRIAWQGRIDDFPLRPVASAISRKEPQHWTAGAGADSQDLAPPLIRMEGVTVRFGGQTALDGVDWVVRQGEHWALVGPNGSGKSTLLKLITGDQLQAYANRITLFGRPRGSGESIWEIKQRIGYLGDELQARYQRDMSVLDVVASGFFDSVGLYRHCTSDQRRIGRQWLQRLELADLADQAMSRLSFGQQRLVLIARAVVKSPRLLILDEPCNGLDQPHRRQVLQLLERIGQDGNTSLILVSHRPDEIPACITHRLRLSHGRVA